MLAFGNNFVSILTLFHASGPKCERKFRQVFAGRKMNGLKRKVTFVIQRVCIVRKLAVFVSWISPVSISDLLGGRKLAGSLMTMTSNKEI